MESKKRNEEIIEFIDTMYPENLVKGSIEIARMHSNLLFKTIEGSESLADIGGFKEATSKLGEANMGIDELMKSLKEAYKLASDLARHIPYKNAIQENPNVDSVFGIDLDQIHSQLLRDLEIKAKAIGQSQTIFNRKNN